MAKILVHISHGPENPACAPWGLLDNGHSVSLFLTGDAVQLIRDAVLDNLVGLGAGKLRELYDAIATGGGKFYLSGMSSKGRSVTNAELSCKSVGFALPIVFARLSL